MRDEKESTQSVERCIHDLRNELNVVMLALGIAEDKKPMREASLACARCIELIERLSVRLKDQEPDDSANPGT
ncbi:MULTISPECIES: hypothetical protein [unclassified Pseudoxanthomonas]|uniref:hypothetical protein n=1 Tax=unclassified Pseudoxanthomonas TaxID=2645906 RepID=UPI00307708E1